MRSKHISKSRSECTKILKTNSDSTPQTHRELIQGSVDCYGDYFNWLNLHSKPPRGGVGGATDLWRKGKAHDPCL